MHIHPPKPLHGWKEFLNEIFVIVVGVLIALGFEQVVEELHWQHKVHEGEERLKEELGYTFKSAAYQITVAPCKNAEFDVLVNRVMNSGPTLEPAPVLPSFFAMAFAGETGDVFNGRYRTLEDPVWRSLEADGTALHMPVRLQRIFGALYRQVDYNTSSGRSAPALNELTRPMPLDPAVRQALIAKIEDARNVRSRMANSAVQVAAYIRDIDYKPDDQSVDRFLSRDIQQSIAQCRKAGHPLADWRTALAAMPKLEKLGF